MGNLGLYQWFTTTSKKVGGPGILLSIFMVGSVIVYKSGEIAVKKIIKARKKLKEKPKGSIYKAISFGESKGGLKLNVGEEFYIIGADKESILIEKIGDTNNPYFVDINFLNEISNYNGGEE